MDKAIDAEEQTVVWAAVKALAEFLESQDNTNNRPEVPENILMAIIQLTDFLNRDIQLMEDIMWLRKNQRRRRTNTDGERTTSTGNSKHIRL